MASNDTKSDLYKPPVVQTPTKEQIEELNTSFRLNCSTEDLDVYKEKITSILASYQRVDDLVAAIPSVKYPRTPGHRPQPEDNPYNAWQVYWKCDIMGSAEGKLAGKTFAIKDTIAVSGVPLMNGSKLLEGYTPEYDATVVTRILDAGGRILGKATCEDFCYSGSSFTNSKSPVRNPVSEEHTTGGSSSGSGALVASEIVDMALGGDQGGSVRIPASWCGIVGLKPTWGLVPYTGAVPMETSIDHLGPMTKSVYDCALLLEVLAGYDGGLDPRQHPFIKVPDYTKQLITDLTGKRIGLVREGFDSSHPDTASVVRQAAIRMREAGATVEDVSIPMHADGGSIYLPIYIEGPCEVLFRGNGYGYGNKGFYSTSLQQALSRGYAARPWDMDETMKLGLLLGEHVRRSTGGRFYGHAQNLTRRLMEAYDNALGIYDVIVMPTLPFPATRLPRKDSTLTERIGTSDDMSFNCVQFNITGHPALSINAGYIDKLPVGMMIIGRHFDETSVLQVANAYEKLRDSVS